MDKLSFTPVTSARTKRIGTPKTVLEKYERLRMKSTGSVKERKNNLSLLVEVFDLKIEL